jgi:flagellar biosynthesis protein FlhG
MDLVRVMAKMDSKVAELAWVEAQRLRMYLVMNQTRVRADAELASFLCGLSKRHYGVGLEELGHVETDDAVWLAVRRKKPLLVDSPASKAARNLERIARRVLALTAARDQRGTVPPPMPLEAPTLYAVLGITRSSSDEEVRRAYKRQREVYALDGLAAGSIFDEETIKKELLRLDEAYDTLLDPVRRRAYDLSTFPDADEGRVETVPRPALAAEQLMLQSELLREIGPDTEFTGALLRKVRESQGIELAEISARTKIARTHLEAIEEEAYGSLPAVVYVRGFVNELAKYLRLDSAQVQRTYLRRMREKAEA